MAKLSLNLDERSQKNGMQLIRLRITNKGTNAFIGTGVYVEPEFFIKGSLYDPIHRRAYMAVEKRMQLQRFVKQFDDFLSDLEPGEVDSMAAKDIKSQVLGEQPKRKKIIEHGRDGGDFLKWFEEFGESRRTAKSQEGYAYAGRVLREYCDSLRVRTLSFIDIDYARVADFSRWLESTGRGASTRYVLESYVRAAYREAQKRHLVSRDRDPYYDYSITKAPQKDIDCLSPSDLYRVMTADLSAWSGLQRARDYALMSFYLCGANLLDMYEMGVPKKGEVVFVRHKVERTSLRPLYIRVEPELAELLKKYGGRERLLSEAERVHDYKTFQRRINRLLKQASEKIGVDVTMAKIRRTWATVAGSEGVSERVIDKSMGHVDKTVTARHYEQYDWRLTAEANRRVIDSIINQKLQR